MVYMSLGSIIRGARKEKSLSLAELAKATSLNVNSLKKYERAGETGGAIPPLDKMALLSFFLEIDPRIIFAEVIDEDKRARILNGFEGQKTPNSMKLLSEIVAALQRFGVVKAAEELDEFIDRESYLWSDAYPGEAELEALTVAIGVKGIDSRAVPPVAREAFSALDALDPEDLLELAENYEDYFWELPDISSFRGQPLADVEKKCREIIYRVITVAAYPDGYFEALDAVGVHIAVSDIKDFVYEGAISFDENIADKLEFLDVHTIGDALDFLPICLAECLFKGRALNLFNSDRYPHDARFQRRLLSEKNEPEEKAAKPSSSGSDETTKTKDTGGVNEQS